MKLDTHDQNLSDATIIVMMFLVISIMLKFLILTPVVGDKSNSEIVTGMVVNADLPFYPPVWGKNPINFTQQFDGYEIKLPKVSTVHFNWDGLRDYDNITIEKPNNTIRIIALGDSHTFGWGVELEDSWPKILENLLNQNSKRKKYQVLNFGMPGYGFKNYVKLLETKGLKYNPDVVIIGFHSDDIGSSELAGDYIRDYMSTHPQIEIRKANKFGGMEYYKDMFNNIEHYWNINVAPSIETLYSFSNINNFSVIFVFGVNIMNKNLHDEYSGRLVNITSDYNFSVFDLFAIGLIQKIPKNELILTEIDQHPSPFYYKIIANGVYEFMEKN